MRGFWTTLRARVIVVTHGFGDANRYGVSGGFVVQLWHGLPFKHLHLDSPSTYSVSFLPDLGVVRRLLAFGYRRAGRGISLFPVASERVRPSIVSGFGVDPENVVVTGDVRDDVLLADDEATRRAEARSRLDDALPDLPGGSHRAVRAHMARRRCGPDRANRRGVGRHRGLARPPRRGAAGPHPSARPRQLRRRPGPIAAHPTARRRPAARRQPGAVGRRRRRHRLLLHRVRLRPGRSSGRVLHARPRRPTPRFAASTCRSRSSPAAAPSRPGPTRSTGWARPSPRTRRARPTATPDTCGRSSSTSSTGTPAIACWTRSSAAPEPARPAFTSTLLLSSTGRR